MANDFMADASGSVCPGLDNEYYEVNLPPSETWHEVMDLEDTVSIDLVWERQAGSGDYDYIEASFEVEKINPVTV